MSIELVEAYIHKEEVKALFNEYTQMLIDGDSNFKDYLELQNYDHELEDLEDLLNITFNKEDYGILNGFMIEQLDCIPSEDEPVEPVEYEGYRFTVLEVENNRIEHVKIEKI